jgi:glucokinase
MIVVAIDLGGSHATCAIVEAAGSICRIKARDRIVVKQAVLRQVLPLIEASCQRLLTAEHLETKDVLGIVMAFPGIVDPELGRILSTSGKFQDGIDIDLRAWSDAAFGLPLYIENDALMALQGEREAGAATGYRDVVMMTLGTGIGAAAVLDGRPLISRRRQAGILGGHLAVRVGGRACSCGGRGCAESEASTWALPALCKEWPGFASSRLSEETTLDYAAVFRLAAQGDAVATQVVDHSLQVWATLAVSLVHAYDPEILLIGGRIAAQAAPVVPYIQEHVDSHAWAHRSPVLVLPAALREDAALFGAHKVLRSGRG